MREARSGLIIRFFEYDRRPAKALARTIMAENLQIRKLPNGNDSLPIQLE